MFLSQANKLKVLAIKNHSKPQIPRPNVILITLPQFATLNLLPISTCPSKNHNLSNAHQLTSIAEPIN